MGFKEAEHRICHYLTNEELEKLKHEGKLCLALEARLNNWPVGTVVKVSKADFAKVIGKTQTHFVSKHARFTLCFEYVLEPEKEKNWAMIKNG